MSLDFLPFIQKLESEFTLLKKDIDHCTQQIRQLSSVDNDPLIGMSFSKTEILGKLKSEHSLKTERMFWRIFTQFNEKELQDLQITWRLPSGRIESLILKSLTLKMLLANNTLVFLDNWKIKKSDGDLWQKLSTEEYISKLANFAFQLYKTEKLSQLNTVFTKPFLRELLGYHLTTTQDLSDLTDFINGLKLGSTIQFINYDDILKNNSVDQSYYRLISALLRVFSHSDQYKQFANSILIYLKMTNQFQDPRATALSMHWQIIKEYTPVEFRQWQKSFNEEDIIFFFKALDKVVHPERKDFWLKYKNSANDVLIILDQPTRESLKTKFSKDDKALAIIERSKQYLSAARKGQLLIILFFDTKVIIEGSATGFGCQIYDRNVFMRRFGPSVLADKYLLKEKDYTNFRGMESQREDSWTHINNWQREFKRNLRNFGILED